MTPTDYGQLIKMKSNKKQLSGNYKINYKIRNYKNKQTNLHDYYKSITLRKVPSVLLQGLREHHQAGSLMGIFREDIIPK